MKEESQPIYEPEIPSYGEVEQAHYLIQTAETTGVLDSEPLFILVYLNDNSQIKVEIYTLTELLERGFNEQQLAELWAESESSPEWLFHEELNNLLIPLRLWDHFSCALLAGQRDVLCWIMGHDNQQFPENLAGIVNALGEKENDENQTATTGDGQVESPGLAEVPPESEGGPVDE